MPTIVTQRISTPLSARNANSVYYTSIVRFSHVREHIRPFPSDLYEQTWCIESTVKLPYKEREQENPLNWISSIAAGQTVRSFTHALGPRKDERG